MERPNLTVSDELANHLEKLPLSSLGFWCAAMLDPCCEILSKHRENDPRKNAWIRETIRLSTYILREMVTGREEKSYYYALAEITPIAEALDFCDSPANSAGHSIYAFMSQIDIVISSAIDKDHVKASKLARPLSIYLEYVAKATGSDLEIVYAKALQLCKELESSQTVSVKFQFFKDLA